MRSTLLSPEASSYAAGLNSFHSFSETTGLLLLPDKLQVSRLEAEDGADFEGVLLGEAFEGVSRGEDFEGVPPDRATPMGVPRGLAVPLVGVLPDFVGVRGDCAVVSWAAAER
jgi:hypothetical protein